MSQLSNECYLNVYLHKIDKQRLLNSFHLLSAANHCDCYQTIEQMICNKKILWLFSQRTIISWFHLYSCLLRSKHLMKLLTSRINGSARTFLLCFQKVNSQMWFAYALGLFAPTKGSLLSKAEVTLLFFVFQYFTTAGNFCQYFFEQPKQLNVSVRVTSVL